MQWLRPYAVAFQLALSRDFVYRTNLLFGRFRDLLLFGGLLYLYAALPHGAGAYGPDELRTYALLATFMFATLSAFGMNEIADEIYAGDLSNYLLRPMSYYGYWVSRIMARRTILIVAGVLEVGVLSLLVRGQPLVGPVDGMVLAQTIVLFIAAIITVQLLDLMAGTFAVWTGRAFGPRFVVYGILIPFLSGALLPYSILPEWAQAAVAWTPFPNLVYGPLSIYFGELGAAAFGQRLLLQLGWIAVLTIALAFMWRRATKSYEAYGR